MLTNLIEKYGTIAFLNWVLLNLGKSLLVFFSAFVLQKIISWLIDRYWRKGKEASLSSEIGDMLKTLLKTLIFYGTYFSAVMISLQFFGLNITDKLNLLVVGASLLKIILTIIAARIIIKVGQTLVERLFTQSARTNLFGEEKRIKTLKVLSQSILTYTVYFIAILIILGILGVNTASILASAGIVGLAVGFGAQNLVKDVITGFFMIFENYFTVGEYINTAGVAGVVEEMGLRTTKIRDWSGELHIIPNSQITIVTNHGRGKARAQVELGIAYQEDIDHAIKILQEAADKVSEELSEVIIDPPVVLGVTDLSPSEVVLTVVAYTKPMEQWHVERELRRALKQALDQEDIEIPYPRHVIIQNTTGAKEE